MRGGEEEESILMDEQLSRTAIEVRLSERWWCVEVGREVEEGDE